MTTTPTTPASAAPPGASAWVTVDLDAIRDNVAELVRRAESASVMAVVKGDAYGHGLVPSARVPPRSRATLSRIASRSIRTSACHMCLAY